MPTYEYRCPEGHEFEKFQRMSDPPEADCPECGQGAQRILSGGAGLLFKGEGFYITDYRSDSYKKAAEKDRSGSKSGESRSGESKSGESKSADSKSADSKSGASSGTSGKDSSKTSEARPSKKSGSGE